MRKMQLFGVLGILAIGLFIVMASEAVSANEVEMTVEPTEFEEQEELPAVEPIVIEVIEEEEEEPLPVWTDIPLTAEEQILLYEKCKELDISYWFVLAICESESTFRPDAVGDSGSSIGYMQINKCNWERMKEDYGLDVHEPKDNLLCGAYILKELAEKYDTLTQVIMSYKCGESRAMELLNQGIVLSSVEDIVNRTIELENSHRQ